MGVKISEKVKVKHPKKLDLKTASSLNPTQVAEGVSVLMQLTQKQKASEKKSSLFNDEAKPIILQISAVKIPVTPAMQLRMPLPHSLNADGADVCLITKDVKRGTKNNHEPSLAHYQALLDEKKVEGITQIIPFRQLVNEHKPFEAKGRMAFMYDAYLVDGEILGKVSKIVGSRFFQRGKHLVPVKFGHDVDLKEEVKRALTKTAMTLHPNGDTYSVKVADTSFTEEQIRENVNAVVAQLSGGLFPGGFNNIRSIYIKTPLSLAIPIYLTLKSSNLVPVPVVDPNLPRACKDESGELSTIVGGDVLVRPDGQVLFRKRYTREDRAMGYKGGEDITDSEDDSYESDGEQAEREVPPSQDEVEAAEAALKPNGKKRKTGDDGDSSDDEVEAAEDAYLNEWQKDFEEKIDEEATNTKATKGKAGKQPAVKKQKKETNKQTANDKSLTPKQGKLLVKPEAKSKNPQVRADSSKIVETKVGASPVQTVDKKQKRKATDVVETTKKEKVKKQKLQVPVVLAPEVEAKKSLKKEKLKKPKVASIQSAVVTKEKETKKEEAVISPAVKKQKIKKDKVVIPVVARKGLNIISAKKEVELNKSKDSLVNDLLKSAIKAVSTPPQEVKATKAASKSLKTNKVVPEKETLSKKNVAEKKNKQALVDELLKSAIKAVVTPPRAKQDKGKKVKKEALIENGGPLKTVKTNKTRQSLVDDLLKSARDAVSTPPEKQRKKSKENKKIKEKGSKLMNVSESEVPVQSQKKSPKALKKVKKEKSSLKADGNFISLAKADSSEVADTPITKTKKKKEAMFKGLNLSDFETETPHEKQAMRYFKQKTQK